MLDSSTINMIITGIGETLLMVVFSTIFGYVFGLPLGVILYISDKDGLKENPKLYRALDVIVNIGRSIPFIILLILIIPLTVLLVGKSYGTLATIVPLTVSAIPYIGRMVEASLKEVDKGVIEAGKAMGATTFQIITKIVLLEARPSLISGATICVGTIISYSAMAGVVGGGGLGDIAIRYGYYRYQTDVMIITVIIIVLIVQMFQLIGNKLANKLDKRK